MNYSIDIFGSSEDFIVLDDNLLIDGFYNFELMHKPNRDVFVNLDFVSIMLEKGDPHCTQILQSNPDGLIAKTIRNFTKNNQCVFVLLKRAQLIIKNVKCMVLKMDKEGVEKYHSVLSDFNKGDNLVWLAGKSADYPDVDFRLALIADGNAKVQLLFDETDVIIEDKETDGPEGFIDCINPEEVAKLNEFNKLVVKLKARDMSELKFNGIQSSFLLGDLWMKYFPLNVENHPSHLAISDYRYAEEKLL